MMLPLEGILVVALEQAVAAPFCTQRLADAGARVIKIERPEGDFARLYDDAVKGQSSYFVWPNRGKELHRARSVKQAAARLLKRWSPAPMFWSRTSSRARRPRSASAAERWQSIRALIAARSCGYGQDGPLAIARPTTC